MQNIQTKFVSIITVVWNARNEIRETVESILSFLNDMVELIIIDGGSTDGTVEILESYAPNPHLRFISEPDRGIYDAMNKGAKYAKGEWMIFVNAGDRLLKIPGAIEISAEAVCYAVNTEDGVVYPNFDWRVQVFNTLPHQGLFYRVCCFRGFDDSLKYFADYDYNLKCFSRGAFIEVKSDVVSFHSLKGVSNSPAASEELRYVINKNVSPFWRICSFAYFKYNGLRYRLQTVYDKVFNRTIQQESV